MADIFHITSQADWQAAQGTGRYESRSLLMQGFIHCSSKQQVLRIANGMFGGRSDLVLLRVDEDFLAAEVRYENCDGGEALFPHVYGCLNLDAVTDVVEFPPRPDGTFDWPEAR